MQTYAHRMFYAHFLSKVAQRGGDMPSSSESARTEAPERSLFLKPKIQAFFKTIETSIRTPSCSPRFVGTFTF